LQHCFSLADLKFNKATQLLVFCPFATPWQIWPAYRDRFGQHEIWAPDSHTRHAR